MLEKNNRVENTAFSDFQNTWFPINTQYIFNTKVK